MLLKNISLAFCVALLTPALAAPVTEEVALEKRINANTCEYRDRANADTLWTINLAGWGNNDETSRSGCGTGLLDNLRGQCGANIISWGCEEVHENPHDTRVTFTLLTWLNAKAPKCVQDAIWLASPPSRRATGVTCRKVYMSMDLMVLVWGTLGVANGL